MRRIKKYNFVNKIIKHFKKLEARLEQRPEVGLEDMIFAMRFLMFDEAQTRRAVENLRNAILYYNS